MPDADQLYATMGVMAGNCIKGDPVWLLLVGPASSGKSTMVNSLTEIPNTRLIETLQNPAALLSGSPKKEQAEDATGGILRELGSNGGALLFSDYTSILSLQRESMQSIVGAFREIYDGRWGREVGTEGGRRILWQGHLGLIGGCTPAIDRYHLIISELGDRTLFFRYPPSDGYGEAMRSLSVSDKQDAKDTRSAVVRQMFEDCGLSLTERQDRRVLSTAEMDRLISIAQFGARARTPIRRSTDSKREIEDMPVSEMPMRFSNHLGQFYLGAEALGLHEEDRWRVALKFAMDSMPLIRRLVFDAVARLSKTGEAHNPAVMKAVFGSGNVIDRVLEDLFVLRIIEREGGAGQWRLTEWTRDRIGDDGTGIPLLSAEAD